MFSATMSEQLDELDILKQFTIPKKKKQSRGKMCYAIAQVCYA